MPSQFLKYNFWIWRCETKTEPKTSINIPLLFYVPSKNSHTSDLHQWFQKLKFIFSGFQNKN